MASIAAFPIATLTDPPNRSRPVLTAASCGEIGHVRGNSHGRVADLSLERLQPIPFGIEIHEHQRAAEAGHRPARALLG
jgi:hypothetical protein